MPLPILRYGAGLARASGRLERLLELLRVYSVDRVSLHSLVFLLEKVYGVGIGYEGCEWRLYATGPYCWELEEDLELLERLGLVSFGDGGLVVCRACGGGGFRVRVDGARVVREAWSILARSGG